MSSRALIAVASALAGLLAGAAHAAPKEDPPSAGRCADYNPLRNPYFGDLHVHTALSLDASTQGTRNRPADAYRFAMGDVLGVQPYTADGRAMRRLQLSRPLDFAAVTDHAELFGELDICLRAGAEGHDSFVCTLYRWWPRLAFFVMNSRSTRTANPSRFGFCGPNGVNCLAAARHPWGEVQVAAEAAYDRSPACRFTSFVAYEWTGGPGTNNIHRNVIFRNEAVPDLPTSYMDEPTPEGLWARLRRECIDAGTGCDVLAIPHNSNISGGIMFRAEHSDGRALAAEDAALRVASEPLVEIMQHKGESECRLGPESADELCGFEKLPYHNFQGAFVPLLAEPPGPMNYVRNVLKEGLRVDAELGVNPFKLGILASTDTHLAAPGHVDKQDYPGHGGAGRGAPGQLPPGLVDSVEFNPGGLAVVWAEENSRNALFDAMKRREVYGTSGPRMIVRFFGGWDLPDSVCRDGDLAAAGYSRGVPMGGDLPASAAGRRAPVFVVSALRDPERDATLQRLQIVKGWYGRDGVGERVYDIAGDAESAATVDLQTCVPEGDGHVRLCAVWRDPAFDPTERAFYYARVIENPTCRWQTFACNAGGVDCTDPATVTEGFEACCDDDYPKTVQERAWTSPIWFTPSTPGDGR